MDTQKLEGIITRKNEQFERSALDYAERVIEQIADNQAQIASLEDRNVELRKELTDLQVQQLDSKAILG